MSIKEEISKNILFYRKKSKLSQKQIAERLGVNHTAVSNWEIGHNSIDIDTLSKLADIFEVSLSKMFGEDKQKSPAALSPAAQRIGRLCDELNDVGQGKVEGYAQDLVDSGKYKKGTPAAKNDVKGEAV